MTIRTVPILLAITYDDAEYDHPAEWAWGLPHTLGDAWRAGVVDPRARLLTVDEIPSGDAVIVPVLTRERVLAATHVGCAHPECNTAVPLGRYTLPQGPYARSQPHGPLYCTEHAEERRMDALDALHNAEGEIPVGGPR